MALGAVPARSGRARGQVAVRIAAPGGQTLQLRARVAEALLAVAVALAVREERLNRMEAWSIDVNCGRKDLKINVRENEQPIEFRSGLAT